MNVISIQSQVVHGCVGNNAAMLPMQVHGLTVAAVPTTLLSNHPHYPTMRGRVLDSDMLAELLLGVEERGLVGSSAAIVSGYLGSAANGMVVEDFVARAKSRNPGLLYILDPVAGDEDIGAFASPALLDVFRDRLLPLADILTPNRWELEHLHSSAEQECEIALAGKLTAAGPDRVIVTGGRTTGEYLTTIIVEPNRVWAIRCPRLAVRAAGTGDLFTGLLTARYLLGEDIAAAASHAVSATFGVLGETTSAPWSELPIANCLDELVAPERVFSPVRMGEPELADQEQLLL